MMKAGAIEEIQGPYGAITIGEEVLQRIWAMGAFQKDRLRTTDGKVLEVLFPGRWNQHEGPDFLGAELRMDGRTVIGDVEIHFSASDWRQHGHDQDPRYRGVRLHVILFPDHRASDRVQLPPGAATLVLVKYLEQDVESYAESFAREVATSPEGDKITTALLGQSPAERREILLKGAGGRFLSKIRFMRERVIRDGPEEALHCASLEVLGYPRNRSAMAKVALQWPRAQWESGSVAPPEDLVACDFGWKLQGVRPANHPALRLRQYWEQARNHRQWTDQLRVWGSGLSSPVPGEEEAFDTRKVRRLLGLKEAREILMETVWRGGLRGSRLDTWCVDAALPWLAVVGEEGLFPAFYHWFPGDQPRWASSLRRDLGLKDPAFPRCNGEFQGLIQLMIEL